MDTHGAKDVHLMKPQIATLLPDGTYGQRDMTEEEIAHAQTLTFDTLPDIPAIPGWTETAPIVEEAPAVEE